MSQRLPDLSAGITSATGYLADHDCPFTAAELLVIIACIDANKSRAPGPARIATKAKQHMDQHHPTTATKETSTDE